MPMPRKQGEGLLDRLLIFHLDDLTGQSRRQQSAARVRCVQPDGIGVAEAPTRNPQSDLPGFDRPGGRDEPAEPDAFRQAARAKRRLVLAVGAVPAGDRAGVQIEQEHHRSAASDGRLPRQAIEVP